jgi:hypothetical protein
MSVSPAQRLAVQRLGRPPNVAEDRLPTEELRGDVRPRIGWLLRTSRLASKDSDLWTLQPFARRLKDLGVNTDAGRVSRWESSQTAVSHPVIRAYEAALGLAPGHLTAICDGTYRSLDWRRTIPARGPSTVSDTSRRLNETFEAVRVSSVTGGDWLAFADVFAGPDLVFVPDSIWEDITGRLLAEMVRSTGLAYVTRFEALRHLMSRSDVAGHVARAVGAHMASAFGQCQVDAISLLSNVNDQRATRLLLRLLAHHSPKVRTGAAWALRDQLESGRVPAALLMELRRAIIGALHDETDEDLGNQFVGLTVFLSPRNRGHVLRSAGRLVDDRRLEPVPSYVGEILPAAVASRIAQPLTSGLQHAGIDDDPMLTRLAREALFHSDAERRHQASLLLMASPYRDVVAQRCIDQIRATDDQVLVGAASRLLTYLSGPAQSATLTSWLGSPDPERRHAALAALAHVPDWHHDGLARMIESADSALSAVALYAAGMVGEAALQQVARCSATPAVRSAADWWLRTGPAVRH